MDKIMLSVAIALFLSAVGVAGDFFLKIAGQGPRYVEIRWFVLGMMIYASTAFGWFYVMKNVKLFSLGLYYALATIMFTLWISIFYFKENINQYEIIGLVTGIISIVLLARFA